MRAGAQRDPDSGDRAQDMADDLLAGLSYLQELEVTKWFMGNHEDRLARLVHSPNAVVSYAAAAVMARMADAMKVLKAEIVPYAGLRLGAAIEFTDAAIGRQMFSLDLTPYTFVDEIAPARTFGLRSQVDQLRAAGLIQGGCLENALVCDGETWLNPPLRFAEEPVRHKILDLLGDLALVGLPRAQVFAYRGSHGLHTSLAAALADLPPAIPSPG
jgi:UDP-3-O-acyl-N-acetylglucosamine deacetylase